MNKNFLKGMRCPKEACQSEGPFVIHGHAAMEIRDDKIIEFDKSTVHFGDADTCVCRNCHTRGTVAQFRAPSEKERIKLTNAVLTESYKDPRLLNKIVSAYVQSMTYEQYITFIKHKQIF
jgi:hypothetical protein